MESGLITHQLSKELEQQRGSRHWGERFVMAAAGAPALPDVALLKWDSLSRWLIDVGEQAQSGIQLAEPLQLLSSFQPPVPHHPQG
jgi:hypothetical protein